MSQRTPPAAGLGLRAPATFAVLAVAFLAIAIFVVAPVVEANPQAGLVIPAAAAVTLAVGVLIALRATRQNQGAVEGILATTAPWLPGALAVTIVGPYLLGQTAPYSIGVGLLTTAVGWLAVGFLFSQYARADTAQPRNYSELRDRLIRLRANQTQYATDAHINTLLAEEKPSAESARLELKDYVPAIESDLGLNQNGSPASGRNWAMGTGYIDLWNRMHRAEEALIEILPAGDVIGSAEHDALRLDGSTIGHAKELTTALNAAIDKLRKQGNGAEHVEARRVLRNIRRDINTFRDDVWDQMLYAVGAARSHPYREVGRTHRKALGSVRVMPRLKPIDERLAELPHRLALGLTAYSMNEDDADRLARIVHGRSVGHGAWVRTRHLGRLGRGHWMSTVTSSTKKDVILDLSSLAAKTMVTVWPRYAVRSSDTCSYTLWASRFE